MSGMCVRCLYDLALPSSDVCEHCKRVAELDQQRTHEQAARLTAEHEAFVIAADEVAA